MVQRAKEIAAYFGSQGEAPYQADVIKRLEEGETIDGEYNVRSEEDRPQRSPNDVGTQESSTGENAREVPLDSIPQAETSS